MFTDTYNDKIVSELNDLLEKNYDGEKGYQEAAEETESTILKNLFQECSQQRYDFGHAIKAEIAKIGGEPDKGSSITSAVHRAWIDFKTLFTDNDDVAVLQECINGEKAALKEYNEALYETTLPDSTKEVVNGQRDQIVNLIDRMETLKQTFKKQA
ncbi:MAG: PA2169 family four-helix-bundle protein [Chitinophagales bacterium]